MPKNLLICDKQSTFDLLFSQSECEVMSYFNRLTDIVTCNLSELLNHSQEPVNTLEEVISEMKIGLEGAQRSVRTALKSEENLEQELEVHHEEVKLWEHQAREHLLEKAEEKAIDALARKQELEDLIAGLAQQLVAAKATRSHLETTYRALQARLSESVRKLSEMKGEKIKESDSDSDSSSDSGSFTSSGPVSERERQARLEAELEALKRELQERG